MRVGAGRVWDGRGGTVPGGLCACSAQQYLAAGVVHASPHHVFGLPTDKGTGVGSMALQTIMVVLPNSHAVMCCPQVIVARTRLHPPFHHAAHPKMDAYLTALAGGGYRYNFSVWCTTTPPFGLSPQEKRFVGPQGEFSVARGPRAENSGRARVRTRVLVWHSVFLAPIPTLQRACAVVLVRLKSCSLEEGRV